MSAIGGTRREGNLGEFSKRVGIMEGKVIAINPTPLEFKEILGMELKEDSKAAEYLGESRVGNTNLRVDIWLQDVKDETKKIKVSFFLEDVERVNKDATKKQYINSVGNCSWAEDKNMLPDWFASRENRVAYLGEEELYEFLRVWLGNLDYRSAETTLQIEWKKLMKGNVKDLKDQINGEWCTNVGILATVVVKSKELEDSTTETKEFQSVYNRAFLPAYAIKNFSTNDYSNQNVRAMIASKAVKDQKVHEKFIMKVTGEYGCKDFYSLKPIKDYDSSENVVATDETLIPHSDDEYYTPGIDDADDDLPF
jgi:hypothetical protein